MKEGKLITLEGINGIGKTYYFNFLREALKDLNIRFNAEINDDVHSGINKSIFEILLSTNSRFFDTGNPKMETLLILAKQANDEERFVLPSIREGQSIVSDRGFDTVAIVQGIMLYRKYGGDLLQHINEVYKTATKFNMIPNKTILFTGDFDKSLQRATIRDKQEYSKEEIEILKMESEILHELSQREKDRFIVIDVDRDPIEIKSELVRVFKKILN